MKEVGKNNKTSLLWVPSHAGIKGNEKVKTIARKGAQTAFSVPEVFDGIGKYFYE